MQKKILSLLIVLIVLTFPGCGKKEEASSARVPATPPVDGELVVTGVLEEISGSFPANDIYNYAYIMKYKVTQVHQGEFADADILVAHYNPRFARAEIKDDQDENVGGNLKSFRPGDTHYLVLSPLEGLWNGALEDDYYKDPRPRYWALWTDRLP